MAKKNYKDVGASILKDVLDSPVPETGKPDPVQLHNTGKTVAHKTGSPQNLNENEDVRLHVYISSELEDRLLDEVFRRKKDRALSKGQASKRGIVENALERFLE